MNPRARSIALSLLLLGLILAPLLLLKFRAGVALSILCYLTSLVTALVGVPFHCGWT